MARAGRVVLGSLGLGLLFVLLNGLHFAGSQGLSAEHAKATLDPGAAAQSHREPAAAPNADADVARFIGMLVQLRQNDETVVPQMRELAEQLCKVDDRCDAKDILAYYLAIPPQDRARGAEESAAVNEVWSGVRERLELGNADPDWDRIRDEASARLREIADRSLAEPDVFPGASALSCLGFIETDRLQRDVQMSEADRDSLLATARDDVHRARAGFARCGMVVPQIQPMYLIAYLHAEAGEDPEAHVAFEDCLTLARRTRQVDWQEKSFAGLIDLTKRTGDVRERSELLNELASILSPDQSWVLTREQSLLLLEQDFGEAAAEFLHQHPRSDPYESRSWQILLGSAHLRRGDLQLAREALASAERMPWGRDVRLGMALVDIRAGDAERALNQLSRPEFLADPDPLARAYALVLRGEALVRLRRYEEASRDLESALAIGAQLQTRLETERDLFGGATSVIGEADRVGVHAVALLAEAQVLGGHAQDAARSIENWQSRTLRRGSQVGEDVSTEDLNGWLQCAESGILTWVVGAESSVVVFVAPDGTVEGAPIPRGRRAIDAAVRRLNDAVRGSDPARAERLASEVRAGVLPPSISKRIEGSSGRILFLVHGPLERLPIEYLFRDQSIVPLILPGLPEPHPGTPVTPSDLSQWNLLGNPVDVGGRALLPGAREELAAVATIHGASSIGPNAGDVQAASLDEAGVRLRVGTAFDRNALTAALGSNRPVHIATHLVHGCGRTQGRIADVGLELSAGSSFCAREILESKPRLPLAVIDACETAEGRFVDAEGLQGVARAFLESGTRNLLVTLWPVEDQAARAFAEKFHQELIAGRRPSEAAAAARIHLRSRGFPAADWAAFRFVGRD